MRTIKYRTWDGKYMQYKALVLQSEIPFFALKNNNFTTDIFVWMQFTDLLDQQGKEIYEGDILEWVWKSDKTKKERGVVKWNTNTAVFILAGFKELLSLIIYDFKFEVIGNIWENPELVKDYGGTI